MEDKMNLDGITGDEMLSDGVETISIIDEDGKVYEFEKPEFDGEIVKVVGIFIIGYTNEIFGAYPHSWNKLTGECTDGDSEEYRKYDLTPIQKKKKWYENEDNFPALVSYNSTDQGDLFCTAYKYEDEFLYDELDKSIAHLNQCRLSTKQELNSLYYEGKES